MKRKPRDRSAAAQADRITDRIKDELSWLMSIKSEIRRSDAARELMEFIALHYITVGRFAGGAL